MQVNRCQKPTEQSAKIPKKCARFCMAWGVRNNQVTGQVILEYVLEMLYRERTLLQEVDERRVSEGRETRY